jgi:hypothetical protein
MGFDLDGPGLTGAGFHASSVAFAPARLLAKWRLG